MTRQKVNHIIQGDAMSPVVAFILFASSLAVFAQTDTSLKHPVTDQQKLADALRAGPAFVTKDALILDWPASPKNPNAEYRAFVPAKATGPVSPESPGIRMTSRCVRTRPQCSGSRIASPVVLFISSRLV
jgi:hypothetical protein